MTDWVTLQDDLTNVLLSTDFLANINIVQLRKLRLQNEINQAVIYTRTRNGRSGCGVLVEMPTCECKRPNVTGPVLDLVCPFLIAEQPAINMNVKTGTLLSAEEVAQRVLEVTHLWQNEGMGGLVSSPKPIEPVEYIAGVVAYRVRLQLLNPRAQTARVLNVTSSVTDLEVTLACATTGAEIYWTPDESFPGMSNPGATKYSAPFTVASGTIVRAAAYATDYLPSNVKRFTVS